MKVFKRTIVTALCIMFAVMANAYDAEINGIYYNLSQETKTAEVTYMSSNTYNKNADSGNVVIPSSVTCSGKSYSVTSIGYKAFYNCSGLTSVTIPNSVTSIGNYAFYKCYGLKKATVASDAVLAYESDDSSSLFYSCNSTVEEVVIGEGVTSIGDRAFEDCYGLTSVTIPNSVTSIGDYAFWRCSGLTSVTIPNSVTSIGDEAFADCSGLTSVTIPNSVTSIGDEAFAWCSNLTSVTIPNSVTSIEWGAFRGCSGLTSVTIGNSVTSIRYMAFYDCSGLNEITSLSNTPPSCFDESSFGKVPFACILRVPEASVDAYKATDPWSRFANILPLTEEMVGVADVSNPQLSVCVNNNIVTVSGMNKDGKVEAYSTSGALLDSTSSESGTARLTINEKIAIVKIGNKSVKVMIK